MVVGGEVQIEIAAAIDKPVIRHQLQWQHFEPSYTAAIEVQ